MIAVLESHNVARTGADLNHLLRKILNIKSLYVCYSLFVEFRKIEKFHFSSFGMKEGEWTSTIHSTHIVLNPLIKKCEGKALH